MNSRQKQGVGMIVAVLVLVVPAIVEAFGGSLPTWLPTAASIVGTVCGVFGITVNLPSNTSK